MKKAAQINKGGPLCKLCPTLVEDLPHIFQQCPFAQQVWRRCFPWLNLGTRRGALQLLPCIQSLTCKSPDQIARLFMFTQALQSIWRSRNQHVLEGKPRSHRVELTLSMAEDHIRALALPLFPGRKRVRLNMAKQLLTGWRLEYLASSRHQLQTLLAP
ncbi:unnamed protein product [Calypogeia fissa]